MELLLQRGCVFDLENDEGAELDILISNGKIAALSPDLSQGSLPAEAIIDCRGCMIFPGFMDMHVHFREPGQEYKEDITSGLRAAAKGGFTAVAAMANTSPAVGKKEILAANLAKAIAQSGPDYYQIVAVTKDLQGKELTEIEALLHSGAVACSDDGKPLKAQIMKEVLALSREQGFTLIEHCEEEDIEPENPLAEIKAVERNLNLLASHGGNLHLAHISCKESIELIIDAKKCGLEVTCEVTPHHFSLCGQRREEVGTLAKMNPPLRESKDVLALQEAIYYGWVDAIATDHAPHTCKEKSLSFSQAPYGVVGLETAVGLAWEYLYHNCNVKPAQLGRLFSFNPRNILGTAKAKIDVGSTANLTVVDPNREWIVQKDSFLSRCKNSPFLGFSLRGKPILAIKATRLLLREDKVYL